MQLTFSAPDSFANRIAPFNNWLYAILEFSIPGYKTSASETASEVIDFFASNPTPEAVVNYHISERGQKRLNRLLVLNETGLLGQKEQQELNELQRIEHKFVMLKAQIAKDIEQQNK